MGRLSRRDLLSRSALLGCSLAASPLVTPISFASGPWDNRLVVIILRGGMDGLDVVRPVGDPSYAALRQPRHPGLPLDGFYELHPELGGLMPLWHAGELSFVHAVSTPYRDKRSHFDGQDHLEAGFSTPGVGPVRDGWLNRLLQTQSGLHGQVAFSIGQGELLVLRGPADVAAWTPEADLIMSPQGLALARLVMDGDPLFEQSFEEAVQIASTDGDSVVLEDGEQIRAGNMMAMGAARPKGKPYEHALATFAARRLREDTRIAAFSINGWDSHLDQERLMQRSLPRLSDAILTLRAELGPVWSKTTVLAMTEFGRTARINGTRGTDHGTGGVMMLAGGTLTRGQVTADWPGLAEADLYQRRDVMPTGDVRAVAAWALRTSFGLSASDLENVVFPGLRMGSRPGLFA